MTYALKRRLLMELTVPLLACIVGAVGEVPITIAVDAATRTIQPELWNNGNTSCGGGRRAQRGAQLRVWIRQQLQMQWRQCDIQTCNHGDQCTSSNGAVRTGVTEQ